jgi:hypothetical protein
MLMAVLVRMAVLVVMLMFVLMRMAEQRLAFLLTVDKHRNMRPGDAALYGSLSPEFHTRQSHRIQLFHKGIRIRQKFQKRRCQHIPCGSHTAIQI